MARPFPVALYLLLSSLVASESRGALFTAPQEVRITAYSDDAAAAWDAPEDAVSTSTDALGAAYSDDTAAAWDAPEDSVSTLTASTSGAAAPPPRPPPLAAHCSSTMSALESSAPATVWPPPCPPPSALVSAYEGPRGSMPLTRPFRLAERHEGGAPVVWSEAFLDAYGARVAAGLEGGSYTVAHVSQVRRAVRRAAAGGALLPPGGGSRGDDDDDDGGGGGGGWHALVIGTDRPWIEVLLLAEGAARVTTMEYGEIVSQHPRITAKPYRALAADVLAGRWAPADLVVTYSSIEHSGLGRYGDALDPDGDAAALRQAWCMTRPGGLALVGVPMSCAPDGEIEFNAHRIYGVRRLAHIAKGWEFVAFDEDGCQPYLPTREPQPIVVLRRPAHGGLANHSLYAEMLRAARAG